MKRTLILALLLWTAPSLGDWTTQPTPDFVGNDGAVRYGADLSKLDLTVEHELLPEGVYGEHDGAEGPYRKWQNVGHVWYCDHAWIFGDHTTSFQTYDPTDTVSVWMQRGTETPILSTITQSRPSGLTTFAVTLVMRAIPCPEMPTPPSTNFVELGDAPEIPRYGDDLSGLDLSYGHDLVVPYYPGYDPAPGHAPKYVGDDGRIWYRPGRVVFDDGGSVDWHCRSHQTEIYTDQEEVVSVWLQRGSELPVLAMVAEARPGQWIGQPGKEQWWPYSKVEVTTNTHLLGGVINPGGAALSHGDGDLAYSDTGFTIGGLTHTGLPPGATASLTTVEITNLILAEGYATLKVYWSDEDVELYGLDEPALRLYWYDSDIKTWILAGNNSNLKDNSGDPLYSGFVAGAPTAVLGDWGVETGGNYVWANIDHASLYVASEIPEPSSLILILLGVVGLGRRCR